MNQFVALAVLAIISSQSAVSAGSPSPVAVVTDTAGQPTTVSDLQAVYVPSGA